MEAFWQTNPGWHRLKKKKKVYSLGKSPLLSRFVTDSPVPPLPLVHRFVVSEICWTSRLGRCGDCIIRGSRRADPGHPPLWLEICIFIAVVASSVNTPLTPTATPAPRRHHLAIPPEMRVARRPPLSICTRAEGRGTRSTWHSGTEMERSSHVNVDFPLGKMIDLRRARRCE